MSNLNQTQQQLNLKNVNQIQFDPITQLELKVNQNDNQDKKQILNILTNLLSYPSTELAQIHMKADRLGLEDHKSRIKQRQQKQQHSFKDLQFCPCCGFVTQTQNIPLCTHLDEVNNIGISTHLYFKTLKNLITLLLIMTIVYSIYSLITNLLASGVVTVDGQINTSYANSYNGLSLGSKQRGKIDMEKNQLYYYIQCWIGLGVVVLWFFVLFYLKHKQKQEQNAIQQQTISAADFTVCIQKVPKDCTKQQMQQSFNKYFEQLNKQKIPFKLNFKIQKFNLGRPFILNNQDLKDQKLEQLKQRYQQLKQKLIQFIQQRQQSHTFNTTQQQRNKLYQQFSNNSKEQLQCYDILRQKLISSLQTNLKNQKQITTAVFVTLQSSNTVKFLAQHNDPSILGKIRSCLPCAQIQPRFKFQQQSNKNQDKMVKYNAKLRRAPQPQDVVWSNIGISDGQKFRRKFLTYFATLILLGASFGVVYGLSQAQQDNPTNNVLSLAISAFISVINIVLGMVIRKLCAYQKNFTQTDHQSSLAIKAILASLINSIVVPMMVNRFIKQNIYQQNGLASDIFMLGITNSFLTPALKLVDPNYIINRLLKWKASWPSSRLSMNQTQLNQAYSLMIFEVGYQYVYMVSLFLFTCFFVSLQPIISIFAILGMFLMYWTQKNSIFNRMQRPIPGTDIVNVAMFQLILFGGLLYSLGALTWSNFLPEGIPQQAIVPNLISIFVSVLMIVVPYNQILKCCVTESYTKDRLFSQHRVLLGSQYDRLNPVTSKEGLQDFKKFYEDFMNNLSQNKKKQYQGRFNGQQGRGRRGITGQHSIGAQLFMPAQKLIQNGNQIMGMQNALISGLGLNQNNQMNNQYYSNNMNNPFNMQRQFMRPNFNGQQNYYGQPRFQNIHVQPNQQRPSFVPQTGFIQPQQNGFVQPQQGLNQPQGGFAQLHKGIIQNQQILMGPQAQGGFVQPQQGFMGPQAQGGFVQPQQGFMGPNRQY